LPRGVLRPYIEFSGCSNKMSPIGYPAGKMSLRESMMRMGIKADMRMVFEEQFFEGSFESPLTREKAGKLCRHLEMVRLAPSAVNKQPWRVVLTDGTVHFYLKRSKGFNCGTIDMQKIDMGIALCHFDLAAVEGTRLHRKREPVCDINILSGIPVGNIVKAQDAHVRSSHAISQKPSS